MKAKIRFIYSTVTEESAAEGDYADHGYYEPGGWSWSMVKDRDRTLALAQAGEFDQQNGLAQALQDARKLGIVARSSNDLTHWWASVDPDIDPATGEHTHYALHIDGITDSTRRRINRWLAGH